MTTKKLTKLLALYLPYILLGLVATNFGEAWRLAEGKELGDKIMSMMGTIPVAFANPLPSLHPLDLLVGLCCGAGLRLAVYLRGKNAKKYRHGMEYGSARWGNAKDIEPFMAPKFSDNIILTKTERLMMSNRPPDPKNARNKNVLVVGGSGSGKTRFWLKPNQLFTESVTDEVLLSMDNEDETVADEILKQFDLLEYKDRHPLSLSGGQKQRVAIASAIVSNREIIVFDEPTSGLDLKHMREVARSLKSLADQGKTLLVITHDPELVMAGCSYVVHMEKGQIKESYPLDESGSKKVLDFFRIRQ